MTGSVHRRSSFRRALIGLGGLALLALLVLAAFLLGRVLTGQARSGRVEAHGAGATAVGEHERTAPAPHAIRQQPSTRARSAGFAVLAAAIVLTVWASRRLRVARPGPLRQFRIAGLPSGRAPPALRIV
jgi:hypothetical protein